MATAESQLLLDDSLASFVQGPVSIVAASRDENCVPSVARTLGCAVSADRRTVTVLLSESQSAELLRDLRRGAPIAVVFSLPSTHQTIQLKGPAAEVEPAGPGDLALKDRYLAAFAAELARLGHATAFSRAHLARGPRDLVAARFTPTSAFRQTPGPGAGAALSPGR
jgi:hypothetical protein